MVPELHKKSRLTNPWIDILTILHTNSGHNSDKSDLRSHSNSNIMWSQTPSKLSITHFRSFCQEYRVSNSGHFCVLISWVNWQKWCNWQKWSVLGSCTPSPSRQRWSTTRRQPDITWINTTNGRRRQMRQPLADTDNCHEDICTSSISASGSVSAGSHWGQSDCHFINSHTHNL